MESATIDIRPRQPDAVSEFLATWKRASGPSDGMAEQHLYRVDSRLATVIEKTGPQRFSPSNARSHFDAIARSIIYQQLSIKAAATIYARYLSLLEDNPGPVQVLAVRDGAFRKVGLSASKVRYLKALATAVTSGELDLERVADLSDDAIVQKLTNLPGIGVWTAQMFLMFRLRRLDILPTHDLGIRRGLQLAYGLRKPAAPGYIARVGRKWAPYRSIASLYLWAAVDVSVE
jgi:DNA-3-methyladenine glycosylase II